jgi:hypothetical protein
VIRASRARASPRLLVIRASRARASPRSLVIRASGDRSDVVGTLLFLQ